MNKILFLDTEYNRFSSEFLDKLSLELGKIDVIKMKTPPRHLNFGPTLFSKVTRVWLPFFLFAIKGFIEGFKYEIIISWSSVVGLFIGLFKLVFFRKSPKLIVISLIFRPRKSKIVTKARFWFCKICLARMNGIVCHSSDEADYYKTLFNLNDGKIKFIPYGIELPEVNPKKDAEKTYIASGGRSNRDYELLKKAIDGIKTKVKVYSTRNYKVLIQDKNKSNLKVYTDTPFEEFLNALYNALFVIIPLKHPSFSSGQLVLLQAMASGKAVIATDCWGTRDYIRHMENGILVPPGDESQLREKILFLLNNPKQIERMGINAKKAVAENFNMSSFASAIGNYVKERGNE